MSGNEIFCFIAQVISYEQHSISASKSIKPAYIFIFYNIDNLIQVFSRRFPTLPFCLAEGMNHLHLFWIYRKMVRITCQDVAVISTCVWTFIKFTSCFQKQNADNNEY